MNSKLVDLAKKIHEEKLKPGKADYNKIRAWQQEYDEILEELEKENGL